MIEEKEEKKVKRKHSRIKCFLPAELLKSAGKHDVVKRTSVRNFSQEGAKLNIKLNINKGSDLELKVYVPEKNLHALVSGEIAWIRNIKNKLEIGLKIKDMDEKDKEEILDWIFPGVVEK